MKTLNSPEQIENHRKRLLLSSFAFLGCIFLGSFGINSLLENRLYLGVVLLVFMGVIIVFALKARKTEHVQSISIFLSALLYLLALYLLVMGGNEGTGAYWTYPILMLMILLVGPHTGLFFAVLYLVTSIFVLTTTLDFAYDYEPAHKIRIFASTTALLVLIITSEWIRFGSYSAIAEISKAHQNFAATDALTKLLNRHGLHSALTRHSLKSTAVVALLDADSFKTLNDNYGHAFGDNVLITLASIIRQNIKGSDLVARWGGEEFLVVLLNTNLTDAERLIDKIKQEFSSFSFQHEGQTVHASFSAGMSELDDVNKFEPSLKIADERLYKAKEAGKNTVKMD
ncbi:GGDEF domain-containing protein [Alteromonas ponticola]|uniref:diguanylate cyclase n=1 Tax=Alteromonas aquimaris TaxID=2998417 RepID=A0ABT3P3Q7_9ALTE|nr:GGDEF domain-containing protein [Alteromonas aquimaris]MCW8107175.1 GGDEF domain-containing protein [Alteromonas aquimaris]